MSLTLSTVCSLTFWFEMSSVSAIARVLWDCIRIEYPFFSKEALIVEDSFLFLVLISLFLFADVVLCYAGTEFRPFLIELWFVKKLLVVRKVTLCLRLETVYEWLLLAAPLGDLIKVGIIAAELDGLKLLTIDLKAFYYSREGPSSAIGFSPLSLLLKTILLYFALMGPFILIWFSMSDVAKSWSRVLCTEFDPKRLFYIEGSRYVLLSIIWFMPEEACYRPRIGEKAPLRMWPCGESMLAEILTLLTATLFEMACSSKCNLPLYVLP